MAKEKEATITIKKGNIIVTMPRNNLIEVSETHDGITFNFKDGLHLYNTDPTLPMASKNVMMNTSNSFEGMNLDFDLRNYNKPVVATPK